MRGQERNVGSGSEKCAGCSTDLILEAEVVGLKTDSDNHAFCIRITEWSVRLCRPRNMQTALCIDAVILKKHVNSPRR